MSPRICCLDKSLFTRNGKIWFGSESANELSDGCGRSPRSTGSYSSRRGPACELRARTERRNRGQNVMTVSRNICHELSRDRVRLDLTQGDGHIYSNKLLWHGPGRDGGFFIVNELCLSLVIRGLLHKHYWPSSYRMWKTDAEVL